MWFHAQSATSGVEEREKIGNWFLTRSIDFIVNTINSRLNIFHHLEWNDVIFKDLESSNYYLTSYNDLVQISTSKIKTEPHQSRETQTQPEIHVFLGKEEFINIQRKRPRTAFSQDQVRSLENEFARNKYLTVGRRVELSKELGLTENQVIWRFELGLQIVALCLKSTPGLPNFLKFFRVTQKFTLSISHSAFPVASRGISIVKSILFPLDMVHIIWTISWPYGRTYPWTRFIANTFLTR